jgi:hypothetical protein
MITNDHAHVGKAYNDPESVRQMEWRYSFLEGWLTDLLNTMQAELDEPTRIRLMAGCGRGCFLRHAFKLELAARGKGSLEALLAALQDNFEAWQAEDGVHIRYGETSARCYCPVLPERAGTPDEIHCHCTRATHQAIFEAALGHPVRVEIIESLRRNGKTCHFLVEGV